MEAKRIADYFVIAGVPPKPPRTFEDSLPPVADPITDLAVINRSNAEPVPKGYVCIEETPTGHKADLNHGSIRSPSVFLCIKRGRDRPPLVDVGVFYDDGKERVIPACRVIRETPSGFPANVNNSGTKTFLTYRRLEANAPANQLVVTDICVILSNKGETPPHAFMLIEKNLNKGMFGSDVYLCYKKSMDRPPFIAFQPVIVDRFPLADYAAFSLSEHLPNFCLPMGASIECWPSTAARPSSAPSTFILTQNSGDKVYASLLNFYEPIASPAELTRAELKALAYIEEDFPDDQEVPVDAAKSLQQIKSICLLSHWPFFEQFKRFLVFLYKTFCSVNSSSSSTGAKIPAASTLESYIFHFMRDIPFPSPERPNILVNLCNVNRGGSNQLTNGTANSASHHQETTLLFTQTFDDLPIPSNGASFRRMLFNLGPENCLHALLFALTEQKILLHSLRPSVLTEVAEAITTIIFPLNWHCPYIPMCPMSMAQYLHAPLPFIFGIDSRYFDYFIPPGDVASIDIDTKAIYLSESKRHLNLKMLPRRETKALRASLESIYERLRNGGTYDTTKIVDLNARRKLERLVETEIQEAFLHFMASILRDFRHYLKPITTAPRVGATDPSSLFDLSGFVATRQPPTVRPFYEALTKTQMFTKFIEERSLVSDKNVSLAFFDECIEKVERWERAQRSKVANMGSTGSAIAPLSLLTDYDDVSGGNESNKTVFITIPDSVPSTPTTTAGGEGSKGEEVSKGKQANEFGPFDHQRFFRLLSEHANGNSTFLLEQSKSDGTDQPDSDHGTNLVHQGSTTSSAAELQTYMFARRAKHEIRKAQKTAAAAKRQSPVEWAKHLLLNAYSLWFTHFPAFSHVLLQHQKLSSSSSCKPPLSLAYQVLQRMQALYPVRQQPDEFCYRVLMILCGVHSCPALAVKVFLDMQRHSVRLNAITYGYYNKAVLEGKWPNTEQDDEEGGASGAASPLARALVKWAKLRNTVRVVFHFSKGHIKSVNETEEEGEAARTLVKRNLLQDFTDQVDVAKKGDEVNGVPAAAETSLSSVNTSNTTTTSSSSSSSETSSSSLSSTSSASSADDTTVQQVVPPQESSSTTTFSSRLFGTPLKEALNSSIDFFSPKSRFGSGIRSSFRMAKQSLVNSATSKPTKFKALPRSSTFGPTTEEESVRRNKSGSLFKSPPESPLAAVKSRGTAGLPRSSTLPQSFTSSSAAAVSSESEHGGSSTPQVNADSRTLPTASTPSATTTNDFFGTGNSPFWTNKSVSALKSYATLFSSSSPMKLNALTNVANSAMTHSNYLISQIKNLAFDEDEVNGAAVPEDEETMLNDDGEVINDETEVNFELLDRYADLFTTLAEHYSTAIEAKEKQASKEVSTSESHPAIVFRLSMMSCTVCRFCSSVLYDEEIMCQWGPEDSNLNTRCIHCHAAFPPSLTIYPVDYRSGECQRLDPISVPYLSPLVLRKELETILSSEGYGSLVIESGGQSAQRSSFLDDHPIVYWNLLWYFSRLNLPSHIAAQVLTATSINGGNADVQQAAYDHRNVSIVCLWDSEQLYSSGAGGGGTAESGGSGTSGTSSIPLHWRLLRLRDNEQSASAATSITDTASSFPADSEIIPQLVEYIRRRKVITPVQYLISERSTEKSKTCTSVSGVPRRFNSIYRQLLFMAQIELAEQIGSATFDKDYHEAFESLTSKEKESLDALDRPPSIGAIFCRMLFKQLSLLNSH